MSKTLKEEINTIFSFKEKDNYFSVQTKKVTPGIVLEKLLGAKEINYNILGRVFFIP